MEQDQGELSESEVTSVVTEHKVLLGSTEVWDSRRTKSSVGTDGETSFKITPRRVLSEIEP